MLKVKKKINNLPTQWILEYQFPIFYDASWVNWALQSLAVLCMTFGI